MADICCAHRLVRRLASALADCKSLQAFKRGANATRYAAGSFRFLQATRMLDNDRARNVRREFERAPALAAVRLSRLSYR